MKYEHIWSMCIKINKVGKQEVEIWRVQKRYPQYGIHIWSSWPNIRFLPSIVAEKNATKNILDGRTEVKQYTPLPSGEWGYNNCNLLIKGQSGEGNNKAYTYTYYIQFLFLSCYFTNCYVALKIDRCNMFVLEGYWKCLHDYIML
jgi:hypothetical protein